MQSAGFLFGVSFGFVFGEAGRRGLNEGSASLLKMFLCGQAGEFQTVLYLRFGVAGMANSPAKVSDSLEVSLEAISTTRFTAASKSHSISSSGRESWIL